MQIGKTNEEMIRSCNVVLGVLDGAELDSGTEGLSFFQHLEPETRFVPYGADYPVVKGEPQECVPSSQPPRKFPINQRAGWDCPLVGNIGGKQSTKRSMRPQSLSAPK